MITTYIIRSKAHKQSMALRSNAAKGNEQRFANLSRCKKSHSQPFSIPMHSLWRTRALRFQLEDTESIRPRNDNWLLFGAKVSSVGDDIALSEPRTLKWTA